MEVELNATMSTQALFREDPYLRSCEAVVTAIHEDGICLDRTVFYPEGGGQPGDTGTLQRSNGDLIPVLDTRKGDSPGEIRHVSAKEAPPLKVGEKVVALLDWERRHRLMRMHTCLHLLSAVIIAPVTGGAVGDGQGRLDFDLPVSPDKGEVETALAELICRDAQVVSRWISDEELAAKPELVKTMSVQPPTGRGRVRLIEIAGIDLQPCGGTHVARTGEIGKVLVKKIEKKGRLNRRVRLVFSD